MLLRHGMEKRRFAEEVARQIEIMTATDAYDGLVIAAPSHTLNALRQEISDHAATRIAATLAKDLVKTPDHELWPRIRACLLPASEATMAAGDNRREGRT
jgi:protein required for attachment to host cells